MQERSEANPYIYADDSAIEIDKIGAAILHRLWVILLAGVLLAAGLYFFTTAAYVENYTSSATLAFTTTTYLTEKDQNGNATGIITQKTHYSEKDSARYQFLLKSDVMVTKIYDELGGEFTKAEIEKSLSVGSTEITGIFVVNVNNNNKIFCENVINVIIATFPDYLKSFDTGLGIDVIKNEAAPVVSNESGAAKKAFYGFVTGAALIIIIIFISEILSDTARRTDDIRDKTSTRFLGAVPTVEGGKGGLLKRKAVGNLLLTEQHSVNFSFIESFKAIRTKIENISAEKGYKLFIVTSTFENEGKTTVAINLACALAQKGRSVLLIDCDLRKPSIMKMAGIEDDGKNGLIQIIKDKAIYKDSIRFVKALGIFILPSGGVSPKSTEVLDAEKVRNVLKKAGEEFDFVIIDTPPAHVVADCLVVAPLADGLIYTIKRDYAKLKDINDTLEEIGSAGVDVVGSVMTMSDETGSNRYFSRKGGFYYYRHRKGYYKGYYKRYTPYGYGAGGEGK